LYLITTSQNNLFRFLDTQIIKKNNQMNKNNFNRLIILGSDDEVKQVREFLKGEPDYDGSERHIDFNKIIQMPDELYVQSHFENECYERDEYPWRKWCINNWGCEQNAYCQKSDSFNSISFQTKDYPVSILISTLSKKFREIGFLYLWGDSENEYRLERFGLGSELKDKHILQELPSNSKEITKSKELTAEEKDYYYYYHYKNMYDNF